MVINEAKELSVAFILKYRSVPGFSLIFAFEQLMTSDIAILAEFYSIAEESTSFVF